MSEWLDDVRQMGAELDEEMGTAAIHTPMIAKANERWRPNPSHQEYQIIGIFEEVLDFMGQGQRAVTKDGLKSTQLASSMVTFSALAAAFQVAPTQGDRISIPKLGRGFRVQDIRYRMPGRTLLVLEDVEAIPAS